MMEYFTFEILMVIDDELYESVVVEKKKWEICFLIKTRRRHYKYYATITSHLYFDKKIRFIKIFIKGMKRLKCIEN